MSCQDDRGDRDRRAFTDSLSQKLVASETPQETTVFGTVAGRTPLGPVASQPSRLVLFQRAAELPSTAAATKLSEICQRLTAFSTAADSRRVLTHLACRSGNWGEGGAVVLGRGKSFFPVFDKSHQKLLETGLSGV